ncbi:MAG: hypothetical protein D3908_06175 [Candidatus Electrothrix sp. AUS4]|nr:hypothetical protein [Candidatus Electrothrix sp. AUS4]
MLNSSPASTSEGELFNTVAFFKNQGTIDATPVTANIYYMNPATGTTSDAVYQMEVPALAINQTIYDTATIQAPCEAGDYFLAACINPGMNVESNSNNNCLLKSLSVSGDCPQNSFLPAINLLLLNKQK